MRTAIILSLVILILIGLFYLTYNQQINNKSIKEGFVVNGPDDPLTQLSTLLQQMSGNISSLTTGTGTAISPEQQSSNEALMSQLSNLNSSLQILINQNKLNTPVQPNSTASPDINVLNDAKVQQMRQDDTINELKRRLANLQKIYSSYLQKQAEITVKYDKIPVYSSCVISEADGRYTYPTTSA
jgi:hypothetical protein